MTQKDEEFIDALYADLPNRKRSQFRIAHTLHDVDGYTVCDVNVNAPTLEQAVKMLLTKLEALAPSDALPTAPKDVWARFVLGEYAYRQIIESELGVAGLIGVYVREAAK